MIEIFLDGDVADYLGNNWEAYNQSTNKQDILVNIIDYVPISSISKYDGDNHVETTIFQRFDYRASREIIGHGILENGELESFEDYIDPDNNEDVIWNIAMAETINDYLFTENKLIEYSGLKEGEAVLLSVINGELESKIVSGRERPDILCKTLSGKERMFRPYPDENDYKEIEYDDDRFDNESDYLTSNGFHFFINSRVKNKIIDLRCKEFYKIEDFSFDIIDMPIRVYARTSDNVTKISICKRQDVGVKEDHPAIVLKLDWNNGGKPSFETNDPFGSNDARLVQNIAYIEYFLEGICRQLASKRKYVNYDKEKQGVYLQFIGEDCLDTIVEGEERPDLACFSFGGKIVLARPYMDEMYENFVKSEE